MVLQNPLFVSRNSRSGFTIDQSLRFTPSSQSSGPYLVKTSGFTNSGDIWTFSCWMKAWGPAGTTAQWQAPIMSWFNNSSSQTVDELFIFGNYPATGRNEIGWFTQGSADGYAYSNSEFQDPSAWYHVVLKSTATNNIDLYINNQEVTDWRLQQTPSAQNFFNKNQTCSIGARAPSSSTPSGNQFHGEGYLAELYFIDGTALDPNNFAESNSDGVWVTKKTSIASYGSNGFHLTFDSSQSNGIGHDSSGNGNHFTASGFDEGDVVLYSKDLFTSTNTSIDVSSTDTNFAGGSGPEFAFDGNTTFAANTSATTNSAIVFRPSTPLSNVTQIEVNYSAAVAGTIGGYNGGNETSAAASGYNEIYNGSAITVNNIYVRNSSQTFLAAIRINGSTVLTDNTDNDVDFNDTPTSNHGTFNPLSSSNTISDANLHSTASSYIFSPTTFAIPPNSGKFYWEVTMETVSGNQTIGACSPTVAPGATPASNWVWAPNLEDIESPQGNILDLVDTGVSTIGTAAGTTYMIAYDSDTQEFWVGDSGTFYKRDGAAGAGDPANGNNPFLTTSDACVVSGETYCPCTAGSSAGATSYFLNVGQMNFVHTPPTGFKALQTNNLPIPTIKNGRDYFEAITYTGNNSTRSITGLEFQPDLVWLKARTGTRNHILFDSVRGAEKELVSNETSVETTDNTSLTSFDANGFSLGANGDINPNTVPMVAWCWKAGGTAASNTNGTITSSVSANTEAGFSIVSYTGNQTSGATVGHGLSNTPECIILKDRDTEVNWIVYHKEVDANPEQFFLHLNSAVAKQDLSDVFNDQAVGSSVFTLGNSTQSNGNTKKYIAYCWHSVEGFSKFDSYTGNNNADGTFVYLGFRPAFLMIKEVTGSASWYMYDTTRHTNNPFETDNTLCADLSDAEATTPPSSTTTVDLLSNGFKQRQSSGGTNSAQTYLYMAFAENPFGGSGVAPATAR